MTVLLVPHHPIAPLGADQVARVRASTSEPVVVAGVDGDPVDLASGARVVFGDLPPEVVGAAASAQWLQYVGAGADRVVAQLRELGREVVVVSAKGLVGPQLAEHAFALLLALTRGVARAVRNPGWEDRIPNRLALWELTGRTLAVVGMGGSGREVARRAAGFGFGRVVGVDPRSQGVDDLVDEMVHPDDLDLALGAADVVVLTLPLTDRTAGMMDTGRFAALRPGAILVNVARGGLVQEQALLDALRSGHLAGAGLDVAPVEPLPPDHPLWSMPNVVVTPHIAGGSPRREQRLVDRLCDNLRREQQQLPLQGVVSLEDGF